MSDRRINKTARDLIAAKRLIEDEANWCPSVSAGQMCSVNALARALGGYVSFGDPSAAVLDRAASEMGFRDAIDLNRTGHAAVMKMFTRAIEMEISASMKTDAA